MGRPDAQSRRDRRMVGDRAAATRLSEAERLRILQQMESLRERLDHDRPAAEDGDRATATTDPKSVAERQVDKRRERATGDRGLADVPRILRTPSVPLATAPEPSGIGRSSARAPARAPDPPGVPPELGQRVEHTIGPDSRTLGQATRRAAPAPSLPPAAARTVARTQDALDELNSRYFRNLWNATAERLSTAARSRHDAPLRRLRSQFERLMGRFPRGIETREAWEEAADLFDRAYERARSRWSSSSMWVAVWNDDAAKARLEDMERRGIMRIARTDRGRPTGAPQIQQYDSRRGAYRWVPVNIDHAVPLERNPWGVLGRDNLLATTPITNQQFLSGYSEHSAFPMAVDRFGGAHGDLDDAIENFVMSNGLSRRQRASAADLDARYGARATRGRRRRTRADAPDADDADHESAGRGRRRSSSSESGRRVIGGLLPALNAALELIMGTSRREFYRDSVMRLREHDRRRRASRSEYRITEHLAAPVNLRHTYERVVGERHPVAIHQLGDLRWHFSRGLERWDIEAGDAHVRQMAAAAVTPAQRDAILNDELTFAIDVMRDLQDVLAHIDTRLQEQDWRALAEEAAQAADSFDGLMEAELHQWAVDIEDAEYLSRSGFRRIATAFNNFYQQLTLLRGLVYDAIHRYRRLIDSISLMTSY